MDLKLIIVSNQISVLCYYRNPNSGNLDDCPTADERANDRVLRHQICRATH